MRLLRAPHTAARTIALLLWVAVSMVCARPLIDALLPLSCCGQGYCCCRPDSEHDAGPCIRGTCGCEGHEAATVTPAPRATIPAAIVLPTATVARPDRPHRRAAEPLRGFPAAIDPPPWSVIAS